MSNVIKEYRTSFKFYALKFGYSQGDHMALEGISAEEAAYRLRDRQDYYKIERIVDFFTEVEGIRCKNVEPLQSSAYYVGHVYHDSEIDGLMETQWPVPDMQELTGPHDLMQVSQKRRKALRAAMKQVSDSRRTAAQKLRESMSALNTNFALLARNGNLIPIKTGDYVYNLCPDTFRNLPAMWAPVRQDVFENFNNGGPGDRPPPGRFVKGFRIIDGGQP